VAESDRIERAIAHVLALRRVGRSIADPEELRRLDRVLWELQSSLGVGVPKRRAAAILGVSVQGLERWIGRGLLPVVRKPPSSRDLVAADALVVLAEEVERLREAGRTHAVLATALRAIVHSGRLPRRLRPNQSARELRASFLGTTPAQRLRDAAELSHTAGILAGLGAGARRRSMRERA
jgi:hypothetical protein